ncbi:hypothetical protein R5M92_13580 [Halomonas sp. Bachu 37]|uniref:hypothetical protein n=1 Tax=Halomonas kashgarensis TaxID=3084920 RepID=UPI003217402D
MTDFRSIRLGGSCSDRRALQILQRYWDDGHDPATRIRGLGGLRLLVSQPATRWLGLTGLCLAAALLSLLSFLVTFMIEELLVGMVAAGMIMSTVHIAGIFERVGWGALADIVGGSLGVLFVLSASIAVLFAFIALLQPDTPLGLAVPLFLAVGITAIG